MLRLKNNAVGQHLKRVMAADEINGSKIIKKIINYDSSTSESVQLWPEPPIKLRVESNYDDSISTKQYENEPYPYPVITPGGLNYKDIILKISVYPVESEWKLTSINFNLPVEYDNVIQQGNKEIVIPVPSPALIGSHFHQIIVNPIDDSVSKPQIFKFWSVKYSESKLVPMYHWDFDNQDLLDNVHGKPFLPVTSGVVPKFTDKGVSKYALVGERVEGADNNRYKFRATFDQETENFTKLPNGCSFTCFTNAAGDKVVIGFRDLVETNVSNGHFFAVDFGYTQPGFPVLIGAGGNTEPMTTTADRVASSKWHHVCMTLSEVYPNAAACPNMRIVHNILENGEEDPNNGQIVYTSSTVLYTKTGNFFPDNKVHTDAQFRIIKSYVDGVQKGEALQQLLLKGDPTWFDTTRNLNLGRGNFEIHFDNTTTQSGTNPTKVDDIKLFDKPLSLAEIRGECALIGLQFPEEGEVIPEVPAQDGRNPRYRETPVDLDEVTFDAKLKVFLIDSTTIAIGANYRSFFIDRLMQEFPYMEAADKNYKNGYIPQWLNRFYYIYNTWDLYRDYLLRIVKKMDDETNFAVENNGTPISTSLIGRWQNSTGTLRLPDILDQAEPRYTDAADLTHFAYLRLNEPMVLGNTYDISYNGQTTTLTYDKNLYSSSIKVNQVGYDPSNNRKYAFFGCWLGTGGKYIPSFLNRTFNVVNAVDDTIVYSGTMELRNKSETTNRSGTEFILNGEQLYIMDFSSVTEEGSYYIFIPEVGYSHKFQISEQAYAKMFYIHARGLFHRRSGVAIPETCSKWSTPAPAHYQTWESNFICDDNDYDNCVTNTGTTYKSIFSQAHFSMIPNNETGKLFRDVYGGYFDAADFDRRPYHFKVIQDLVTPYLLFPENFTDNQLNIIESGNGIPDILSEAEWFLDCLRRGQRSNGGIAAWIEASSHEKNLPWLSDKKYYIGKENRRDSLQYVYTCAQYVRALLMVGTELACKKADIFLTSAIKAFKFGADPLNSANFQFTQTATGNVSYNFTYHESILKGDQYVIKAAVAMFVLTKDPYYASFINQQTFDVWYNESIKDNENTFANEMLIEFLFDLDEYFPQFCQQCKTITMTKANQWKQYQESNPYFEMTWSPNHAFYQFLSWGTGHPETRGKIYIYAWKLTNDNAWKDQAYLAMNWASGCNALGRTFTTGLGVVNPVHFLDNWLPEAEVKWNKFEPIPGISPYGIVGDRSGVATPYGFCLYRDSRTDMNFQSMQINILPDGYSETVTNSRGAVASWLQTRWPLWRQIFELEDTDVVQSEFTVAETISGKAFMCGCLMAPGIITPSDWKDVEPATDRYQPEGAIILP